MRGGTALCTLLTTMCLRVCLVDWVRFAEDFQQVGSAVTSVIVGPDLRHPVRFRRTTDLWISVRC